MNETASKFVLKNNVFLHCSIFSMPRIPSNLRERAIGMLDAGMSTEHVARHVGYTLVGHGAAGIPFVFSDETRFSLQRGDGRVREYRRRNERYADCCVLERDRLGGGGGGSVVVWE